MLRALGLTALLLAACSTKNVPPLSPEQELRGRLGIPKDAQKVLIFSQSSHLDIDWQKTFDDYYSTWVDGVLTSGRQLCEDQPRAYYSVAEMAYLQRFVQEHPDELKKLKAAVARNQLHIVGGGMTSPDTLLPETELLIRDYLYGLRFAEEKLGARPRSAWLPDSFGHSPTAPDVLAALGFKNVGFARIDGALTPAELIQNPAAPFHPGSSAEKLKGLGTADFQWQGAGGATVLAHWIASGLYCTGDSIDYDEPIATPGGHDLGIFHGDDPAFTDNKINSYVGALQDFSKTPYLFVPVGCDFQKAKSELLGYLDGYNQRQYPKTHVWAALATFDDYETLMAAHTEATPQLALDPTPYFMGFYGTRPDIKRGTRDAARGFFSAEPFASVLGQAGADLIAANQPSLELLTRADHHDFITGTASDEVTQSEQRAWLTQAQQAGDAELIAVAKALGDTLPDFNGTARVLLLNPTSETINGVVDTPVHEGIVHAETYTGQVVPMGLIDGGMRIEVDNLLPFSWRTIELKPGAMTFNPGVTVSLLDAAGQPVSAAGAVRVVLQNERVRAQWDKNGPFALTSVVIDGAEALNGPSFLPKDYRDEGGLYRMGHEMAAGGCTTTELTPDPDAGTSETVQVLEQSGYRTRIAFAGGDSTREAWLDTGGYGLNLAFTSAAGAGITRDVNFALSADGGTHLVSLAGGYHDPGADRVYTPTWWPAVEWVSSGPWALLLRQSTGVRFDPAGGLEVMAVRDAGVERCDVLGGVGTDPDVHRIEWELVRADTPTVAMQHAQAFNRPVVGVQVDAPTHLTGNFDGQVLSLEGDGVVSAIKPADRGAGVVVRVLLTPGPVTLHLGTAFKGRQVVHVDSAERDLEELGPVSASIVLDREHYGPIASIRIR
ncbi:MAG: hypothetical protein QM723_00075 [Myxococcaceae bacterium]